MTSMLHGYDHRMYVDHACDYRSGSKLEDPESTLYGSQKDVELLPVPSIESSLQTYLTSVVPLLSPQELLETQEKTEKFKSTIGRILQKRLLDRATSLSDTSWFAEWWNDVAYLGIFQRLYKSIGYRESIVHNVSYYLQFKDEPPHAMDQCRRASRIIHHCLKYRVKVMQASLSPDIRSDGKPMCNAQWKYIFNTCRIPGIGKDFVRTYAGDVFSHIVVACRNRFFVVNVCTEDFEPVSINDIEAKLNWIKNYTSCTGNASFSVGVLSADNRDIWNRNRTALLAHELNRNSLTMIESSAFVVCLDNTTPVTRQEVGKSLLHSNGQNRFWDKSFQIVVFANGKSGYIGEHSMSDGTTSTRFANDMLQALFSDPNEVKLFSGNVAAMTGCPKELSFVISDEIGHEILKSTKRFHDLTKMKELDVLMFHGFGKNKIKSFRCSPDGFAQVAMQLAYYKSFGYCSATYESTQTRNFLHGRTEVTRSCSISSLSFCRKMVDRSITRCNFEKEAYILMMDAINSHSSYSKKASKGQGCDRHLSFLKTLLKPGEDDSFFRDKAFKLSSEWRVSTSGLVGELMDGWGFGEVVPDGLGIGYSIQKNKLRFTVTSGHKSEHWAKVMVANIEWALLEMESLALTCGSFKSKL